MLCTVWYMSPLWEILPDSVINRDIAVMDTGLIKNDSSPWYSRVIAESANGNRQSATTGCRIKTCKVAYQMLSKYAHIS